jgi:hypothetical protein
LLSLYDAQLCAMMNVHYIKFGLYLSLYAVYKPEFCALCGRIDTHNS